MSRRSFVSFAWAMTATVTAAVSLVTGACGRAESGGAAADAAPADAASEAAGFDATILPRDSGPFADVTAPGHPDGGPPPIVACDGGACALPPSTCIDDNWMRYYVGGSCSDAGLCEFTPVDMFCDPSGVKPDCYQGACRVVIVR